MVTVVVRKWEGYHIVVVAAVMGELHDRRILGAVFRHKGASRGLVEGRRNQAVADAGVHHNQGLERRMAESAVVGFGRKLADAVARHIEVHHAEWVDCEKSRRVDKNLEEQILSSHRADCYVGNSQSCFPVINVKSA